MTPERENLETAGNIFEPESRAEPRPQALSDLCIPTWYVEILFRVDVLETKKVYVYSVLLRVSDMTIVLVPR